MLDLRFIVFYFYRQHMRQSLVELFDQMLWQGYPNVATLNRFSIVKKSDKKTTAVYLLIFLVLVVVLCKPFEHASARSVIPYVVAAIQYTVGLKHDSMLVTLGYNDDEQIDVFDWVIISPDVMTKTPPLILETSK